MGLWSAAAKLLHSCLTLCDPIDGSPPGSSVPVILQARTLEWVAISFSNARMRAKSLQSCPTLCNPMDSSPPGSSIHRILSARILEWGAISYSTSGVGGVWKHYGIRKWWTKLVEVMEFQLSYFKSWKMMLWKCCTQYASKFGKLSSGHRAEKRQFSFQSQRKAMPKNAQTTTQLHSSHMLVK